jgi:hypothetical protein
VDDGNVNDVRAELARLEAEEALVSAQRRHLHRQMDFGSPTDEARAKERDVSNRRRELHRRIDELRELLGLPPGPPAKLPERPDDESQGLSMGLERSFLNDAGDDLEGQHLG